jgi:hypothetical protein
VKLSWVRNPHDTTKFSFKHINCRRGERSPLNLRVVNVLPLSCFDLENSWRFRKIPRLSVNPLGAFELKGPDPLRALSLIPADIN